MGESSAYQEICKSNAILHSLWRPAPSRTGSYGRQAVRQLGRRNLGEVCSARNKDQKLVGRFINIGYFIGYYTAVPLKMYGKYGRLK